MKSDFKFDRMEFAGSIADLGILLPISLGLILINGLDPTGVFLMVGLLYIFSGAYYRTTVPVQPMKVIGAYAIAMGVSQSQVLAAALVMGSFLLLIGTTGLIKPIGKYTPKSVVRGVQLGVGVVLIIKGVKLMIQPDPALSISTVSGLSTGIFLGGLGILLTLALLGNRRYPSAIALVLAGITVGAVLGKPQLSSIELGFHLPTMLGTFPSSSDFLIATTLLVLPQIPMTIGNALISMSDLSNSYFGKKANKVSLRALACTSGLGNLGSFILGGIPMCHGSGGLSAHYRFGARTAGANLIIGTILVLLAVLLGPSVMPLLGLLPRSILGVLLLFAGVQLAIMVRDLKGREDLFIVLIMLGIALTVNLGVAFLFGIALAHALKNLKLKI